MYDTVIIGGGIAGLTAAMYAARKRMDYVILSDEFGGQFIESGEILNYPGIISTDGIRFSGILKEQMAFNGVNVKRGEIVRSIKKDSKGNFKVKTEKNTYESRSVIIATGSHPRKLNVPGEEKFTLKGVHYCTICDGPLYHDKDVVVVGGGDSALESADFLLNIAKTITIINKSDSFNAHRYLQERIENKQKVRIINNADVTEILGNKMVTGIKYEKEGRQSHIETEGVFVEIGRIPNTAIAKGLVKLDEHDHIKVNVQTETSTPGVFAAGDCTDIHEYQYIIAAGQGAAALIKAARYLTGVKK